MSLTAVTTLEHERKLAVSATWSQLHSRQVDPSVCKRATLTRNQQSFSSGLALEVFAQEFFILFNRPPQRSIHVGHPVFRDEFTEADESAHSG